MKKDKEREIPIEDKAEEKQNPQEAEKAENEDKTKSEVKETKEQAEPQEEKTDTDTVPKEQYLRLLAEFTNYKKRTAQEKEQLLNLARGNVISKLLPVVDDFGRLMGHIDSDNKDVIIEGIENIYRKMMTIFEGEGLKKIDSLNTSFDPNLHEAMMTQPTEDKEKDDTVVMVYEDGYMLNDKLLRPAKVIVAQYDED